MNPDDTTQPGQEPDDAAAAVPLVPQEVRQRLAAVTVALGITPRRSVRRGGVIGAITGEQQGTSPSVTDALRIARFACDDYRQLDGVDQPDAPFDSVTAHDLLAHLTRKDA